MAQEFQVVKNHVAKWWWQGLQTVNGVVLGVREKVERAALWKRFERMTKRHPGYTVVASLTTIPSRIEKDCRATLDSLLSQVDHIFLSVSHDYARFGKMQSAPAYLRQQPYADRVTVVWGPDYGPASKYRGALDWIPPQSWVLVVDDDQVYHATLVEKMLQRVKPPQSSYPFYPTLQNRCDIIASSYTSGGLIHGFVGNMMHQSNLVNLRTFPFPDAARFVDDQWMSIYHFLQGIPIVSSGVEHYHDMYAVTHDGHENINGPDALFRLGNRDAEIQKLRQCFGVRMDTRGKVEYADAVNKI
jgi:hypothetical protein